MLISVASYGGLGHVPPRLPTTIFFGSLWSWTKSITALNSIRFLILYALKRMKSAISVQSRKERSYFVFVFDGSRAPPGTPPEELMKIYSWSLVGREAIPDWNLQRHGLDHLPCSCPSSIILNPGDATAYASLWSLFCLTQTVKLGMI